EGRQAQLDALEADLAPAAPLGGEVDPDHYDLSPGRRSASPTATARAGPAAWTSSAYAESIWMRWNGLVSSTGMPQFDDRESLRPGSWAHPPGGRIFTMRSDSAVGAEELKVRVNSSDRAGGTAVS